MTPTHGLSVPARRRAVAFAARFPPSHSLIVALIDHRWPGPRLSGVVRTRVIDDYVTGAMQAGCTQLVLAARSGMACHLAFGEERVVELAHLGERRGVLQALCCYGTPVSAGAQMRDH